MIRFLAIALALACLSTLAGCKEVEEEFSGIYVELAPGPLAGVDIDVYDASLYLGPDSNRGLITSLVSDQDGRVRKAMDDDVIGRSLILVARFPADDPGTPEDERAYYTDFEGTGNQIRVNPGDGPWFSMVEQFLGLDARAVISPMTTMAYHSLASQPASEVGRGNLRYVIPTIRATNLSLASSFGLGGDLSQAWPSQNPLASGHQSPTFIPKVKVVSARHRYAIVQMDRAARTFADLTTDANDNQIAFYRGMVDDARDGVIDGMLYGEVVPDFAVDGAPPLQGFDAEGASLLWQWIADNAALGAEDTQSIAAAADVPISELDSIPLAQGVSTGAVQPSKVEGANILLFPQRGGMEVEVRGYGFLPTTVVEMGSDTRSFSSPAGSLIRVDGESQDEKGEIVYLSHDRLVFRMPDLSLTSMKVSRAKNIRGIHTFLKIDYDGAQSEIPAVFRFVGRMASTDHDGLVLMNAAIVSDESPAEAVTAIDAFAPRAQEPAGDGAYLELRVANADSGDDALTFSDVRLAESAASEEESGSVIQNGSNEIDLNVFGGATGDLLFPLDLANEDQLIPALAPGEFDLLRYPIGLAQESLGSAFSVNDLLRLSTLVQGSADTELHYSNDFPLDAAEQDIFPLVPLELVVRDPGTSPAATGTGVTAPAAAVAGEAFNVTMNFDVGPLGHRAVNLYRLEVEVDSGIAGEATQRYAFESMLSQYARWSNSLWITGSAIEGGSVSMELPASIGGESGSVQLTLESEGAVSTSAMVNLTLFFEDDATGARHTISDSAMVTIAP